jgi:transcriptional regulator with XRE-family HTH domain
MAMRWTAEQRESVGRRIRAAMELKGWDTVTLGSRIGLGAETVRRHMRGQTLTLEALTLYSQELEVSTDWLLAPATGLEPVTYRFQTGDAA